MQVYEVKMPTYNFLAPVNFRGVKEIQYAAAGYHENPKPMRQLWLKPSSSFALRTCHLPRMTLSTLRRRGLRLSWFTSESDTTGRIRPALIS